MSETMFAKFSAASPATSEVTVDESGLQDPVFEGVLRRIREHRQQSLANPQSLLAALGCLTADALETQAYVAKVVRDELTSEGPSLEVVEDLAPLIAMQGGLSKQALQLAELELRHTAPDAVEMARLRGNPRYAFNTPQGV